MQTLDEIWSIVAQIDTPHRRFIVKRTDGFDIYLQVEFEAPCAKTGEQRTWHGRKWYLSTFATDSEIVQTCLKALLTSLEHEARESFLFKGVAIFGPHFSVDRLVELGSDPKNMDVRDA